MGILVAQTDQQIDFSKVDAEDILPIFDASTDMRTIAPILSSYRALLSKGKSLAAATDFQWAHSDPTRARDTAEQNLVGEQRHQWFAWKKGITLPPLNKATDIRTAPKKPSKSRIYWARAMALGVLYRDTGFTVENVAYFVEKYVLLVPLLRAAAKVENAERILSFGQSSVPALDMVEYFTIKKVLSTLAAAEQQIMDQIKCIQASKQASMDIVSARISQLTSKLEAAGYCDSKIDTILQFCFATIPINTTLRSSKLSPVANLSRSVERQAVRKHP